jgi:hypothetical protein
LGFMRYTVNTFWGNPMTRFVRGGQIFLYEAIEFSCFFPNFLHFFHSNFSYFIRESCCADDPNLWEYKKSLFSFDIHRIEPSSFFCLRGCRDYDTSDS